MSRQAVRGTANPAKRGARFYQRLSYTTRGSMSTPVILALVYGWLCAVFHIYWFCSIPFDIRGPQRAFRQLWLSSEYGGITFLSLFQTVNVLFIAYVLISFVAVLLRRARRRFYMYSEYAFALLLLVLIQIYLVNSGNIAGV